MAACVAMVVGAPTLASADAVSLCAEGIPDSLTPEMRLELVARGHQVVLSCEGEGWVVGIEDASLAEVWVWVRDAHGARRRSRVPRSLDAVDGRALGIAAATLMDAMEPTPPVEPDPEDPRAEVDGEGQAGGSGGEGSESGEGDDPDDPDPDQVDEPDPPDLVPSSRSLTPDTILMAGGTGAIARIAERVGGGGGFVGIGRHASATARLDGGLAFLAGPAAVTLSVWVGLKRVWGLDRSRWFEVGGALRYAQEIRTDVAGGPRIGIGLGMHLGYQRGLSRYLRLYWRVSAAPLVLAQQDPEVGAIGLFSFGVVVAP